MEESDEVPQSEERKIPHFLIVLYAILLLGGVWALFTFWNGSKGWFDRGSWHRLQEAASTTYTQTT